MPEGGNSIVVKVNNLCPAEGNPLCSYDKGIFPTTLAHYFGYGVWEGSQVLCEDARADSCV